MSWLSKWFKVEPVVTETEFYELKAQVNKLEVGLQQLRDIVRQDYNENDKEHARIKTKLEMLSDRPIAQKIHNQKPKPKVPNVNEPYPYSPYRYDNGPDLSTAMVVTAAMVDLTDTYAEVSSLDSSSSSSDSGSCGGGE